MRYVPAWLVGGLLIASGYGGNGKMAGSAEAQPGAALIAYVEAAQADDADKLVELLSSKRAGRTHMDRWRLRRPDGDGRAAADSWLL